MPNNLVAPVMPQDDHYALDALQRGFAGLAANRRHAEQVQLELQQMAQQERIKSEQFAFQREQLAQQSKLQDAQIGNLNSEASLHNAQAGYWETYKKDEAKKKQDALSQIPLYTSEQAKIPAEDWGTTAGANQLALLADKYSGIAELPGGRAVMNSGNLRQRIKERQLATNNIALNNSYVSTFKNKGLDPDVGRYLEYDATAKKFVPNDVWGVNENGSPFITLSPGVGTGGAMVPGGGSVVPHSQVENKTAAQQMTEGYRFKTLTADQAQRLLQMRNKLDQYNSTLSGAPADAIQGVINEQQQVSAQDRANEIKKQFSAGQIGQDEAIKQLQGLGFQ